MDTPPDDAKSCDPQLSADLPDATWGVEQLGQYAQAQERSIVEGECSLTALYWRMGNALELARHQFTQGQWGCFLSSLAIHKTRASKARAIYRTFASEAELAQLSVQAAYEQRERRAVPAVATARVTNSLTVESNAEFDPIPFLVEVCRRAELCTVQVESLSPDEATLYLSAVDETLRELNSWRTALQHCVQSG